LDARWVRALPRPSLLSPSWFAGRACLATDLWRLFLTAQAIGSFLKTLKLCEFMYLAKFTAKSLRPVPKFPSQANPKANHLAHFQLRHFAHSRKFLRLVAKNYTKTK
jgi:hypothetical protein